MIKEETPLTLAEVAELAGDTEKEKEVKTFIKKFIGIKVDKAKELREELKALNIIKLKEEHIVKIVDFKPADAEDLNKVLAEVSLDQDETNKILEVIKKY